MSFTHHEPIRAGAAEGIVGKVGAALAKFARHVWEMNGAVRAGMEARRLHDLSDEELAAIGLKREDIIAHAFHRYMNY
ncbi:MAG: DUF1127 domain-containing protein [Pikeienuella sp.]